MKFYVRIHNKDGSIVNINYTDRDTQMKNLRAIKDVIEEGVSKFIQTPEMIVMIDFIGWVEATS